MLVTNLADVLSILQTVMMIAAAAALAWLVLSGRMGGVTAPVLRSESPFWWPDTRGFLALSIVMLIAIVVMTLLWKDKLNLDQNTYGALLTLLGVLAGCFKDVFAWAFGSTQAADKKDDTLAALATAPTPPSPPAPATSDQIAEATLTNGQRAFYDTIGDPEEKKRFLGMSNAERDARIGKG